MAVEFDIKVSRPVSLDSILDATESLFRDLFAGKVSVACTAVARTVIGESDQSFECFLDDNTYVTLTVHKAGDERDLGVEGGYWLSVAADRVRNGQSSILALLFAAAAARLMGTDVVDEWLILGTRREVAPDGAIDFVRGLAEEASFEAAARALAARLGVAHV